VNDELSQRLRMSSGFALNLGFSSKKLGVNDARRVAAAASKLPFGREKKQVFFQLTLREASPDLFFVITKKRTKKYLWYFSPFSPIGTA